MNSNKLTYSRTIEVGPEQAELLNHLIDRFVTPVLERRHRIAQGAIHEGQTPEQQLESILNFGRSERIEIPAQQQRKSIVQGGLNQKEQEDLDKVLSFGQPHRPKKEDKQQQQEEVVE